MAELEEYKTLLLSRPTLKKAEFQSRLSQYTPFDTEAELDAWVKKTEADIKRKQKRDLGEDVEGVEEEPSFPLVDVPDEELDEAGVKEKRKQRLMKAGWEARVKIREEKKRERERIVRCPTSLGVAG
jgi:actin-related protein 5